MIDPTKENYPACTVPLSATSPVHIIPEILRNTQYAQDYVEHVALIRELLDQASLSTNSELLMRSNNQLLRSLVKVVRNKPDADMVRQTTTLMGSDEDIAINMPSAPMPMPEGDATASMHPAFVTQLAGSKPYYVKGGLPTKNDTDNIYHPRFIRDAIPPVNTFHAVVHDRASRWVQDADMV